MNHRAKLKFTLLMAFMIVSWALAFPLIKIGLEDFSPINLTIMRFVVVCVTFLILRLLQPKKFSNLLRKDIPIIFVLGFFGVIIYHLGLNYGEQYISPGAASLIIATIPLFIVIFATIFLDEKLTKKRIVGIFLALTGVIIISLWGKPDLAIEIKYISGALAVLLAALMGAFYTIAGKKLLHRYSAFSLTAYAMLLGSVGLLPLLNISIVREINGASLLALSSVIFLGVCSTVIGYMLWYVALKIKDASEISIYLYCIPIVTIIIDLLIFDERISYLFLLGGFLIISGLLITNLKDV